MSWSVQLKLGLTCCQHNSVFFCFVFPCKHGAGTWADCIREFMQPKYLQRCEFFYVVAGPIPVELGEMTALQELDLGNNQLTGENLEHQGLRVAFRYRS